MVFLVKLIRIKDEIKGLIKISKRILSLFLFSFKEVSSMNIGVSDGRFRVVDRCVLLFNLLVGDFGIDLYFLFRLFWLVWWNNFFEIYLILYLLGNVELNLFWKVIVGYSY